MFKVPSVLLILFMALVSYAGCDNVHCKFEYAGIRSGTGCTDKEFMRETAVSELADKYCVQEFMLSFRTLNWYLYQFEQASMAKNHAGVSNAVKLVSSLLQNDQADGTNRCEGILNDYPNSLKLQWMEKIEYSVARMVLGEARDVVAQHLELLLPESILDQSEGIRSVHSIRTFKRMLSLAAELERFHESDGCYPLNLDSMGVSGQMRKCSYGRDIEYEYYKGKWVLRCRCESWEGGLQFDEYVPVIYAQRKHLDLCLSPTFNEKRFALFSGKVFCPHDERLSCRVIHDKSISGVHKVKYDNPSAGNFRVKTRLDDNDRGS